MGVSIEELEEKLGGRIKSVCLLILSCLVLVLQAKRPEGQLKEEPLNPIDTYFQTVIEQKEALAGLSAEQETTLLLLWQDCWEQELSAAYDQLACEEPLAAAAFGERVRHSFGTYNGEESRLEAYLAEPEQMVSVVYESRLSLMRQQALRIHALLEQPEYRFREAEADRMLENSGL